jgi:2-polyprenyl-3-methyl-5-hydroxy-6-metoxy-1,4-benzoquinol methylase
MTTPVVPSPFDAIAANYTELWSATANGLEQRQQVWREIDSLLTTGQHILDLGCGIGDDALHLQSRGLRITAIDASREMIAVAQQRGISARHLSIERIGALNTPFHGALSNFGVFNCIADPARAARDLAQLLPPNAHFAMCVLSRFYWRESLAFNFRRWSGHTQWRGLDVFYRTSHEWQRAFAPHFKLLRRVSIGGGDHTLYIWRRS